MLAGNEFLESCRLGGEISEECRSGRFSSDCNIEPVELSRVAKSIASALAFVFVMTKP